MAVPDPYKAANSKTGVIKMSAPKPLEPDPVKTPTTKMSAPTPPAAPEPVKPQAIPAPVTTPTQPDAGPYQDWRTKTSELFSKLEGIANQQFVYDPNTDPAYQAQRNLINQRAADANRSAMELANQKGILGSSMTGEALLDNNRRAELEAASFIPQYREQAYGQFRDRLQSAADLLRTASDLRGYDDDLSIRKAELTGSYLPPDAQNKINRIIQLGEAWKTGTTEQRDQFHQEAERLRSELQGMGIDPTLFGADKTTEERTANIGRAGIPTMAAQEMAYQQARDKIADDRYKAEFDENVRQFDLNYALEKAVRDHQMSVDDAQLAISRMNANTSRYSAETSRMNSDREQRRIDNQQNMNSQQAEIMDGIAQFDNAADASAWLNANARTITENLGADTFTELKKMLPLFFGEDTSGSQASNTQRIRQQATEMAQKDLRWKDSKQDKEAIVQEYIRLLTGS